VFSNSQIIPRFKWFPRKLSELSFGSRRRSGKEFREVRPATRKSPKAPKRVQQVTRWHSKVFWTGWA